MLRAKTSTSGASQRSFTHRARPADAAQCVGVEPSSSAALTSAPASRSVRSISACPQYAATCAGVSPSAPLTSGDAFSARSRSRTGAQPLSAATCKPARPSSSTKSTSPPRLNIASIASGSRVAAAAATSVSLAYARRFARSGSFFRERRVQRVAPETALAALDHDPAAASDADAVGGVRSTSTSLGGGAAAGARANNSASMASTPEFSSFSAPRPSARDRLNVAGRVPAVAATVAAAAVAAAVSSSSRSFRAIASTSPRHRLSRSYRSTLALAHAALSAVGSCGLPGAGSKSASTLANANDRR